MTGFEVLAPGLLTSVQDQGRYGRQRVGMSPAGAMDSHSLALANLLVGNPTGAGGLECTFLGPTLRFEAANTIALTGADMSPTLDGVPLPMGQAVPVAAGSVLKLNGAKNGCRCYIAFHGGLDLLLVDGSQATLLRSGIGGLEGRKLAAGDRIGFSAPDPALPNLPLRRLARPQHFEKEITVRVVPGPQDDRFTQAGLNTFFGCPFKVSSRCDRMASRLEGPAVEHLTDANIPSDGIPLGAVQIPGDGQPIIMMSEHQGSGGYTKIATLASVDIPLVAQCPPGGTIRFAAVGVEQAQALYLARQEEYRRMQTAFELEYQKIYRITVNGQTMSVGVAERAAP